MHRHSIAMTTKSTIPIQNLSITNPNNNNTTDLTRIHSAIIDKSKSEEPTRHRKMELKPR